MTRRMPGLAGVHGACNGQRQRRQAPAPGQLWAMWAAGSWRRSSSGGVWRCAAGAQLPEHFLRIHLMTCRPRWLVRWMLGSEALAEALNATLKNR